MNKTIWLTFGISVILTFVCCLLPSRTTGRILIHVENDNDMVATTAATADYAGFDTYYVQHNYCLVKFPVVIPSK
jgi:hypothetical protein